MASFESDADLLAAYVAAFGKLDSLYSHGVPSTLRVRIDEFGWEQWQPQQITTSPSALEALYKGLSLPGRGSTQFPPLYESLLLSYRWAEVDLGSYRLVVNAPAEDFAPLLAVLRSDVQFYATLVSNGYVQFGRGPDTDFDPICFDFRQRQKNGDCRIVKIDHEDILCNGRIREVAELAPNFRSLILDTIAQPTQDSSRSGGNNLGKRRHT